MAREWARQAERLGFHGIWVFDHFQPYPDRDDSPVLEAWTTLAALSQATERMVLGTLVSCTAYRPAMVTVKMADNVHALSGSRLCLGLGAAWDEPEFEFLGLPFPSAAQRSDRLEAVLRACRSSWNDLASRSDASAADRPGRAGRPLLLVGGEGRAGRCLQRPRTPMPSTGKSASGRIHPQEPRADRPVCVRRP